MTSYGNTASRSIASIGPPRLLVDLVRHGSFLGAHALADAAAVARTGIGARLDLLRGRPEAALLRHGHAIRHVRRARESMATYKAIDRLVARYPAPLATYRTVPVSPERFLFFVGYSRSGHSLVGALLDAHQSILISHELHALKHFRRGHSFDEVVDAIQYNSRFFEHFGRGYFGYSYEVASQYQGRFSQLRLIGDKKANGTTRVLRRNPGILDALPGKIPVPFVFLHVVRNPFDNIASRARRAHIGLELSAHGYFDNADVIARLKQRHPDGVIDVYLDDLVADPKATLAVLLHRLGFTEVDDGYLDDCAKIVFTEARRTRDDTAWDPALRRSIAERLGQYSFFQRFAAG
jgi:hypothetical protein